MITCILCSSGIGSGGLLYNHPINWFADLDEAPEECPQCGSGLGMLRIEPSEPAAITAACEVMRAQKAEIARLRAEQERSNRLIASAIANAHTTATRVKPLWVCVCDLFAVGSTTAHELCRSHGYDPDQAVTLHVRAVKRTTEANNSSSYK